LQDPKARDRLQNIIAAYPAAPAAAEAKKLLDGIPAT
jgi:hypothetical protein